MLEEAGGVSSPGAGDESVVSLLMWVLGTELGFSARAASAHWLPACLSSFNTKYFRRKKLSQCLWNGIRDGNYRYNLVIFLLENSFTLPAPLDVSLLERKMQAGCFGPHLEF